MARLKSEYSQILNNRLKILWMKLKRTWNKFISTITRYNINKKGEVYMPSY